MLTLPWHSPGPELSSDIIKPSGHLRTTLRRSRTPFRPVFLRPLRGPWRKEARQGRTSPLDRGGNGRGEGSSTCPGSLAGKGQTQDSVCCPESLVLDTNQPKNTGVGREEASLRMGSRRNALLSEVVAFKPRSKSQNRDSHTDRGWGWARAAFQ